MDYDETKFEMRETFGICGLPPLLWQKSDQGAFGKIVAKKPVDGPILDLASDTQFWLDLCQEKNVVVQAGGCMGMVPLYYSNIFKNVYTFEPDVDSYFCLQWNCNDALNVEHRNVGLGSVEETQTLVRIHPQNAGMHRVIDSKLLPPDLPSELTSQVKLVMIDSLGLRKCDLIHLDVELYELEALKGAVKTITRCYPVIVVETGQRLSPAHEFLTELGYTLHRQLRMDCVYLPPIN